MNWRNVQTVWMRELRDQLRDRRTLFMIAVLPLLMYPLMGMSFFQLAQFMRSHEAKILVAGAEQLERLEGLPPLLEGDAFAASLAGDRQRGRLEITQRGGGELATQDDFFRATRGRLSSGELDAAVYFPDGFAARLEQLRSELRAIGEGDNAGTVSAAPKPIVLYNSARDGSRLAFLEVERLLDNWRDQVVGGNLAASRVPAGAVQPFRVAREDVANEAAKQAGIWSKLLPFVVFVWALTGAFYPAVDLCAGEKERGTLETLLVSPASRNDLVWGKLLTVITFSMATALLNLAGIAATGTFIAKQMAAATGAPGVGALGLPPLGSLVWLVIALPPVAALYSALSFACAAFARSTKEGQYYFMPLFLGLMPLMLMPLSPGVELNLGTSLAPVMGLVLLLRSLMEGDVLEAVRYALPVTVATFGCCLLAIRWAVGQFNQEGVIFRGDERFELGLWLRGLLRRRHETPSVAIAVACVAMIFLGQFIVVNTFLAGPLQQLSGFAGFAAQVVVSQATVLLPALLLAVLLVSDRPKSFRLNRRPRLGLIAAAAGLALLVHPASLQLGAWIQELYPLPDAIAAQLQAASAAIAEAPSPLLLIGLLALLPAVVEELTFRGLVLGGLQKSGSNVWAIVLSAVAFGAVHSVFQQALAASIVGLLIGYLAVVTRSLWPCIAFHAVHNALPVLTALYGGAFMAVLRIIGAEGLILRAPDGGLIGYHPVLMIAGLGFGIALLGWIARKSASQGSVLTETEAADPQASPPLDTAPLDNASSDAPPSGDLRPALGAALAAQESPEG